MEDNVETHSSIIQSCYQLAAIHNIIRLVTLKNSVVLNINKVTKLIFFFSTINIYIYIFFYETLFK